MRNLGITETLKPWMLFNQGLNRFFDGSVKLIPVVPMQYKFRFFNLMFSQSLFYLDARSLPLS